MNVAMSEVLCYRERQCSGRPVEGVFAECSGACQGQCVGVSSINMTKGRQ